MMNATRLEVMKAELAREILNEQNESLLQRVFAFFRKEKQSTATPPCQYTVAELHEQIEQSMADYRAGRIVTMEQMRERHPAQ